MKHFNDYIHKIREEPAESTVAEVESAVLKSSFTIQKSDNDKMQVFGWASVSLTEEGEQIEDWQGDLIDPEDLEQAVYEYVLKYRDGGEMHEPTKKIVGTLIESVVFTEEKMKAIGIPAGTLPVGWWIGFQIHDEDVWEKIKNGTYSMFSIEGKAERVEIGDE